MFIVYCPLSIVLYSQSITFEKYYDYGFAEAGNAVQQTSDGGYIIFGRQGISMFTSKALLIKTDSDGQEQWHKLIGGANNDNYAFSGQQTIDGGYIMAGFTSKPSMGDNVYLVKTDSNGDTLWTKNYGGSQGDIGWSVQQTSDGGYIIGGQVTDMADTVGKAYLIKTDSNGDTLWTKKIITTSSQGTAAYSVQQTTDGGYVMTGVNYLPPMSLFIIKTNSSGDTLWTKTIGQLSKDLYGQSIRQTSDGGYIIAGYGGFGDNDFYWWKTDGNGDTLWAKSFGSSKDDNLRSVRQTADGGYILAGSTYKSFTNDYDLVLIKTNTSGDTLWTKKFNIPGNSEYIGYDNSVGLTSDGGYILTGLTDFGSTSALLIKTDSIGYAPSGIIFLQPIENLSLLVYPNPASSITYLVVDGNISDNMEGIISDMQGRQIYRMTLNKKKNMIDVSNIIDGLYFFQIYSQNKILAIQKIIVQH